MPRCLKLFGYFTQCLIHRARVHILGTQNFYVLFNPIYDGSNRNFFVAFKGHVCCYTLILSRTVLLILGGAQMCNEDMSRHGELAIVAIQRDAVRKQIIFDDSSAGMNCV